MSGDHSATMGRFRALPFIILALLVSIMAVSAIHARRERRRRLVQSLPTSLSFRQYISSPESRMVVYSTPMDLRDPAQQQMMRRQLGMLRQKFDGIVLYRCDADTERILDVAEAQGWHAVLLTIWSPTSASEVRLAAKLVRRYRDRFALAVSIGSEGLLEDRYTMNDLDHAREDLLEESSGTSNVETTTDEPWWLYLRDRRGSDRLRAFGDFISANIHVVWDTDISNPWIAAQWTAARGRDLKALARRTVLIREAGIPGGGSSPRPSLNLTFTRSAQAEFWKAWLSSENAAAGPVPPIVVFEGVDNSAKRWQSFESDWGLVAPDLAPHPAWSVFSPLPEAGQNFSPSEETVPPNARAMKKD